MTKINKFERIAAVLQGVVLSGLISVGTVGVMGSNGLLPLAILHFFMALALILLSLIQLFVRRAP